MKNHLREVDFIRAFAALSVIAIHVSGAYAYSSNIAELWNIGMRYAVPLFIILSGFVLYYGEKDKKSFSCISFWSKRTKKIIVPYVLWNIIYMVYNTRHDIVKITGDVPSFLEQLGYNVLTGTGTYHLYFVLILVESIKDIYLLYLLKKLNWEYKCKGFLPYSIF